MFIFFLYVYHFFLKLSWTESYMTPPHSKHPKLPSPIAHVLFISPPQVSTRTHTYCTTHNCTYLLPGMDLQTCWGGGVQTTINGFAWGGCAPEMMTNTENTKKMEKWNCHSSPLSASKVDYYYVVLWGGVQGMCYWDVKKNEMELFGEQSVLKQYKIYKCWHYPPLVRDI